MAELRTLPGDLADAVARFLVATGLEEDPERAYEYAVAARGLAARVGIVRETAAIAAYQAGRWADALTELRAARRLTGRDTYLPLMADCERALGRLDRALDIVTGPEARSADRATQIELHIVESGIRRDQSLPDAAVVALQVPELTDKRGRAGHARLFYAYADALFDAGREEEAREWFAKAAAADPAGETDAAERVDELDEVLFEDLNEDWDDEAEDDGDADVDKADEDDGDADEADEDDADEDEADADEDEDDVDGESQGDGDIAAVRAAAAGGAAGAGDDEAGDGTESASEDPRSRDGDGDSGRHAVVDTDEHSSGTGPLAESDEGGGDSR